MEHDRRTIAAADADGQNEIRDALGAIQEQGRLTLELVRTVLGLLLPKEGGREGPSLEELLAAIMGQQRDIIAIGKTTQADLIRLGQELPTAVAEAVENNTSDARMRRL
jgi:hypothetical protein